MKPDDVVVVDSGVDELIAVRADGQLRAQFWCRDDAELFAAALRWAICVDEVRGESDEDGE